MTGRPHPHLRLVERRPLPRLSVRLDVVKGHQPFGRTRPFSVREADIEEAIAVLIRLEARRS
jgi:hypothetical protein